MPDSTRTSEPELTALANDFDVVGELGGATPGTRYLIATRKSAAGDRRAQSARVIIEIVRPPEGDESHALDHVASDTKLLSTLRHRRLVPILEGRWLGDDAFAVVREQVDDPSVADLLARGDPFTNVRTAAILREVHGLLQWAREHDVVHRRVTTDRVFLEPTSDRVRVSFGAGPLQRVRSTDPTTDDVVTVVKLAVAMLSGATQVEETEGQTFAELRPDLPDRLHEETERLLKEPADDHDLTLYLALIGMADPVAEGETERDRIREEVLEEQRVEREKLANERAEIARKAEEERAKLAAEGEELRAAFEKEKAKLEGEFAAAQRLLAAERTEMQRIIADERAELAAKRDAMERAVNERVAEIERAAAADREAIEALRERIQKAAEEELERLRATALEEIGDAELKLNTGRYATPRFVEPQLAPFPGLSFSGDKHLSKGEAIETPAVGAEPSLVTKVVEKLKSPRRQPIAWRRWAVRGGIAAAILATAGSAMVIESRTPDVGTAPRAAAVRPRANAQPATPAPAQSGAVAGAPTITTENGAVGAASTQDSVVASVDSTAASGVSDSVARVVTDSAALARRAFAQRDSMRRETARRDSVRREIARRDSLRRDSERRGAAAEANTGTPRGEASAAIPREPPRETPVVRTAPTRRDDRDLMMLSDSLSGAGGASSGGAPTTPIPGSPR